MTTLITQKQAIRQCGKVLNSTTLDPVLADTFETLADQLHPVDCQLSDQAQKVAHHLREVAILCATLRALIETHNQETDCQHCTNIPPL